MVGEIPLLLFYSWMAQHRCPLHNLPGRAAPQVLSVEVSRSGDMGKKTKAGGKLAAAGNREEQPVLASPLITQTLSSLRTIPSPHPKPERGYSHFHMIQ